MTYPPNHTFELAKRFEAESGKPQYIVRRLETYIITERMPLLGGEWYTTDGIRHG